MYNCLLPLKLPSCQGASIRRPLLIHFMLLFGKFSVRARPLNISSTRYNFWMSATAFATRQTHALNICTTRKPQRWLNPTFL